MNAMIKFGVASALALGYATAHASVAAPSSGSSDLVLFVQDLTSGESYARDTGISINSVLPTGSLLPSGTPKTSFPSSAISANINLAADANLTTFLAGVKSTDTVEWAVQAAQYPTTSSAITNSTTGNTKYITTTSAAESSFASKAPGNLAHWGSGFNTDIGTLNLNMGSASSVLGTSAATAGVWDATSTAASSIVNWYANGPSTIGVTLGSGVSLYGLTGDGSSLNPNQVYNLGTLTLTAAGLLETAPIPTPIPAAVWLFGSGLLGLVGVGRRKAVKA